MEENNLDPHKQDVGNILKRMLKEHEKKEEEKEAVIANIQQWKSAINKIVATDEGKLLIKLMLRHNRLFAVEQSQNPATILSYSGKQEFYLDICRPYIDPSLLGELETQEYKD